MDTMELLILLGALAPVVILVTHFIPRPDARRLSDRLDKMRNEMDKMRDDLSGRIDKVNDNLNSRMGKTEHLVGRLVAYLQGERKEPLGSALHGLDKIKDSEVIDSKSPISLTETGLKLAEKLKAAEAVEKISRAYIFAL